MDLRANTAVDVLIGPFVDVTDGNTTEDGLTLTAAEIKLSKNGQALAGKNDVTSAAFDDDGYYNCELDTTDLNTEGNLVLIVHQSANALPVRHEYMVLSEAAWDSLYAAKDTGFMDVNVKAVSEDEAAADNLESACDNYSVTRGLTGTALPAVAAEAAGGLYTRGTGAGQINQALNGLCDTNAAAISNDVAAANNLESACDNYSSTRGLTGTALPAVNAEAAGGLYTRGTGAGQINQSANGQSDAGVVAMQTNVITAGTINANAITAAKIALNAIAPDKLAPNCITAGKIADGAIDAATFAAGAIDAASIATDAVSKLRSILSSTTTSAGTITTFIDTARTEIDNTWIGCWVLFTSGTENNRVRLIVDFNAATDTFTFAPPVSAAVATSVTYDILPAGGVDVQSWLATEAAGVAPRALVSGRPEVSVQDMATGIVTATVIAADAIGVTQLADNAISNAKIASNAIDSAQIAANAIGQSELDTDCIGAAQIALNAIGSAELHSTAINEIRDAIITDVVVGSVNDAGPLVGDFDGDAGLSATDDFYNGSVLVFTSGTLAGIARRISNFVGSSRNLQFLGTGDDADAPFPVAPADTDTFRIVGRIGA